MTLSARDQERLVNVLNRLASNHDGERAAAGLIATRLLKSAGETWDSVICALPAIRRRQEPERTEWPEDLDLRHMRSARDIAIECLRHRYALTLWETTFLSDIQRQRRTPSPRQALSLERIALRLGVDPYKGVA